MGHFGDDKANRRVTWIQLSVKLSASRFRVADDAWAIYFTVKFSNGKKCHVYFKIKLNC